MYSPAGDKDLRRPHQNCKSCQEFLGSDFLCWLFAVGMGPSVDSQVGLISKHHKNLGYLTSQATQLTSQGRHEHESLWKASRVWETHTRSAACCMCCRSAWSRSPKSFPLPLSLPPLPHCHSPPCRACEGLHLLAFHLRDMALIECWFSSISGKNFCPCYAACHRQSLLQALTAWISPLSSVCPATIWAEQAPKIWFSLSLA